MWSPEMWTVVLVAVAIGTAGAMFWRDAIDAIERFRGGGPRTPMHPSPSDDGPLLTRRTQR